MEYALPYFITVAVPTVFLCVNMVLSSALRGAGETKTPMQIALLANVINAVLDYILIFGILNFNGFGVLGAGLATTISRIISLMLLLKKINGKDTKIELSIFNSWKIDYKMQKSITKISILAAIERLIMRSGQLIYGGKKIRMKRTGLVYCHISYLQSLW